LSERRIAELTRLDYTRAMAFIAIAEAAGEMLGVVRCTSMRIAKAANMRDRGARP